MYLSANTKDPVTPIKVGGSPQTGQQPIVIPQPNNAAIVPTGNTVVETLLPDPNTRLPPWLPFALMGGFVLLLLSGK